MLKNQTFTKSQAIPKLKQFCGYQERSHSEVKEKLFNYGLYGQDIDEIISTLIAEDYLNEQRFAIQFAGGRFRMKQWGKVKIRYELKQKQVSEICIRKALASIDLDDYEKTLQKLAVIKWNSLKGERNIFTKRRKLLNYLLQKGYESDLCREVMKELESQ